MKRKKIKNQHKQFSAKDVPVVLIPVILSPGSDSAFSLLVHLVLRATGTENPASHT
jgi:hypothetical protein